ncbi:RNA polymerase sporulation sigma factor SigH [Sporosarcina sp. P26b]|uniref:RNA polymerase sporulation sigma factor SigH n=1 Tax=Sporosarcina TaxID=1569 RepID=UPI000A17CAFE|nr:MULTISPECIES: RNA polymerase sporulation sigma factor SigH [Sporosarcina]ARK21534.1 RNA polymerase factor sigma-70 [Sporosarcina ureae]PIC74394.1 RNA polymerase sporulation sigma factor SigH [Sporosarcina sp. P17b]PIC96544.1 RNA polymerase sporulation sigma factor SigH [Sporosarcina sp. P26b]
MKNMKSKNEFTKLSDEEMVELIHLGNSDVLDFLITKFQPIVRMKARTYFIIGGDREDIVQEGMIGLYKAIRDFRPDRLSSFKVFAELCITRQIITAIKTATRQKHIPLNTSVSLDKPMYDEDQERTLLDIISGSTLDDPEDLMIHKENFSFMEEEMNKVLSGLEKEVLTLYLEGQSYREISEVLNRQVKSIDNALQRIKRKLEHSMAMDLVR